MPVPSLEDIAFFASIKWKQKELLPLIVERAYFEMSEGKDSYCVDIVCQKMKEIADPIIEKMMQYTCLPLRFRAKWVVAFQGILTQLNMWGFDLAENLFVRNKTDVRYCIERIVQDQLGQIDKPKTILKILQDSMFLMRFVNLFMIQHLVEVKELKSVAQNVLKEGNKKRGAKMLKLLWNGDVEMMRRNIDNLVVTYSSEIYQRHAASTKTLWKLAAHNDLADVRFYVKQQRQLYPDSLQEQLFKAADYVLKFAGEFMGDSGLVTLREDVLMYLHDNMEPDTWLRVLETHFVKVFLFMLQHSWRHRWLCVRWFTSVQRQHTLDLVKFIAMFRPLPQSWDYGVYDFYDVMLIFQSVWLKSPDHLKTNDEFIIRVIPTTFCVKYDLNVLAFFLNSYGPELQRNLLCQIVICLFEKKKEDLIPKCLETVPNLGLNMDNYKMMFNADFLKMHLLQKWALSLVYKDNSSYQHLLLSILRDIQNIDILKQELLNDKNFMIRYLSKHGCEEYIYDFLMWCHNGNTELLEAYKSQLRSEGLIENVYESIILQCDTIPKADNLLKNIRFTNGEVISIKKKILNKSNIKIFVLYKVLMDQNGLENFKDDLAFYFEEEHEQQTMEKLFLYDEGRDAILRLLTPTWYEVDEDPPVSCLLSEISNLKNVLLKPYSLVDKVESMLSEYGHPNSRELQIENYQALSERERLAARKLLDCNYRCVRAFLRRDFTDEELRETELRHDTDTDTDTYTELSLDLAEQAELDIPVVL